MVLTTLFSKIFMQKGNSILDSKFHALVGAKAINASGLSI